MKKNYAILFVCFVFCIALVSATPSHEEFNSGSTSVLSDAFPQFVESKEVNNGKLIVEPEYSGWYAGGRAVLLYKEVSGNFVVETDLYTEDGYPGEPKPPSNSWHTAGLLVRNQDAQTENWLKIGIGFVGSANGNSAMVGTVIKNTHNEASSLKTYSGSQEARLRICRIGDEFSFYINEGSGWVNPSPTNSPSQTNVAGTVDRSNFPNEVQVGLYVDEFSPGKMYAEFDYVRYASVSSENDCTSNSIFDENEEDNDEPEEVEEEVEEEIEEVIEPFCGDDTVDAGEQCDDGNNLNDDGCSSTCEIEIEEVPEPVCGDGTVDAGEQCDDGNTINGDGCSSSCSTEVTPVCGNGVLESQEECDDGNTLAGDGCSQVCTEEAIDVNDPLGLNDDFSSSATLNEWTIVYPTRAQIAIQSGRLVQEPTALNQNGWYQTDRGIGACKSIPVQNFAAEVYVDVHNPTAITQPPTTNWGSAGFVIKSGANPETYSQDWTMYNTGHQGATSNAFEGAIPETTGVEIKSTVNDQSLLRYNAASHRQYLKVCRLGDYIHYYRRESTSDPWIEEPSHDAYNPTSSISPNSPMYRPDFETLASVCLVSNAWDGSAGVEAFFDDFRVYPIDSLSDCVDGDLLEAPSVDVPMEAPIDDEVIDEFEVPHEAPQAVCGNGIVETGEQCDDGNLVSNDGCSSVCNNDVAAPSCGNGVQETGEQCDDGNNFNGDGCTAGCGIESPITTPECGNGEVEASEECDDNNLLNGDGCSSTCTIESSQPPQQIEVPQEDVENPPQDDEEEETIFESVVNFIARLFWNNDTPEDEQPPVESEEDVEQNEEQSEEVMEEQSPLPVNDATFRHAVMPTNLQMIYSGEPVIEAHCEDVCLWSNPDSWLSGVPSATDNVYIPVGTHMILDISTPSLGGVTIDGILQFDNQNIDLTAEFMIVSGTLSVGTQSSPFAHDATITLTDTDLSRDIMDMGTRGIMVMGGLLELHGDTPEYISAQINEHAEVGDTSLTLTHAVDWNVGDEFILLPSDFYGIGGTELLTVTGVSGNTVSFSPPLQYFHWGRLQYPCHSQGMCLTPDPSFSPPHEDGIDVLDERSHVALLSRNIVIQAPNDAAFTNNGFGAHLMIMNHGMDGNAHMGERVESRVEGVEFNRVGQAGIIGRYPYHNHILSYAQGEAVHDVDDYLRRSTIRQSQQRGIVIHGTNGFTAEENVLYDILGHGVFFEDAVERRNTVNTNIIAQIRSPDWSNVLKNHEMAGLPNTGPSGFWLSNPDNTVSHNVVADSQGFGYWLAFPEQPSPGSVHENVDLIPNRLQLLEFDHNTAYSTFRRGLMLDNREINVEGDVFPLQYTAFVNYDEPWTMENTAEIRTNYFTAYKVGSQNDPGCIWHRGSFLKAWHYTCADATGVFFNGAGMDGLVIGSLAVAESLNSETTGLEYLEQNGATQIELGAFDTYHGTFIIEENTGVGFQIAEPFDEQDDYGFFSTRSAYIRQVDKFFYLSRNNYLINSDYGSKVRAAFNYFNLAGAIWDPFGELGPEENYWVYDEPFFTAAGNCVDVPPVGNGASCPGEFYGVQDFVLYQLNNPTQFNEPFMDWQMDVLVERRDPSNINSVLGTWNTPAAPDQSLAFQHMRGFATQQNGVYVLDFPNYPENLLQDVRMEIENLHTTSDQFVLAVPYHGSSNVDVYLGSWFGSGDLRLWVPEWLEGDGQYYAQYKAVYDSVNSVQEVLNSNERVFYHDASEGVVWVNVVGGELTSFDTNPDPLHEPLLYMRKVLHVFDVDDVN